jgi:hypothetical protein
MTTRQIGKPSKYHRQLLALTDEELEMFVRDWVSRRMGYHSVERFSGPGDLGRDVAGFLTSLLHEGDWHNYQCKQYGITLPTAQAIAEVGKVLYFSHKGEFAAPAKFYFVAPRGINRNLKKLFFKPSDFRQMLLDNWDHYCASAIIEGELVLLTASLRQWIEAWDFSRIESIGTDLILDDPAAVPVLAKWFGADPGPAPTGVVPDQVQDQELPYVRQLLDAYEDREKCSYSDHEAILSHISHGPHLATQRERFFDTDAFNRFYRESVDPQELDVIKRDIYYSVVELARAEHSDSLACVDEVMKQAAATLTSGSLAKYARVSVKQGICHHLANEGVLKWRKS